MILSNLKWRFLKSKPAQLVGVCLFLLACQLPGLLAPPTDSTETPTPTSISTAANSVDGPATPTLPVVQFAPTTNAPISGSPVDISSAVQRSTDVLAHIPAYQTYPVTIPEDGPIYGRSLAAIANPAALPSLTPEQLTMLENQGFVILDDQPESLSRIYALAAEQNQPFYIASDLILLHARRQHRTAWEDTQRQFVAPMLVDFSHQMALEMRARFEDELAAEQPDWTVTTASRRNWVYFTIAARLLDPAYPVDPQILEEVRLELDLMLLGGDFVSPYTGETFDYRPFQQATDSYTRALLWYQLVPFTLNANQPTARLEATQMQLVYAGLTSAEIEPIWQKLYVTLLYFEGDRPPSAPHWHAALELNVPQDSFILTAAEISKMQAGYALLPRPSSPTAEAFSALVYNQIGGFLGDGNPPETAANTSVGTVRVLPQINDLAAAQGSRLAADQLAADQHSLFDGYDRQMELLSTAANDGLNPASITDDEAAWLYNLQPYLRETAYQSPYPSYMRQPDWALSELQSWRAGWLAQQFEYARVAIPPLDGPATANAYLEPQPDVYGRLRAHTRQIIELLGENEMLSIETAEQLSQLEELLFILEAISYAQMRGQALSPAQKQLLNNLPAVADTFPTTMQRTIFTDLSTGRTLSAEIAGARPIVVIVLIEGELTVTVGGVLSVEESIR